MKRIQPLIPQQTAENTMKVIKSLQQDTTYWQQLRLTGSLKTMTSKQFIEIIDYFGTFITGKPIVNRPNEHETDILAFMRSVKYPYTVTKSALKTPTAMHSYPECVAFLAWMSEFANTAGAQTDADSVLKAANTKIIAQDDRFPNIEYTKYVADEVRKGFSLWNNQKDNEFEAQKDELADNLIAAATNGAIPSRKKIEVVINELRHKVDEFEKVPCIIRNEKQYLVLEQQIVRDEEEYLRLVTDCDKLHDEVNSLKIRINDMAQRVQNELDENQALENTIAAQLYSISDLNALKTKISTMSLSIKAVTEESELLRADGASTQLQKARLQEKKIMTIKDLNVTITRFHQCLCQLPLKRKFSMKALHLEPTAPLAAIKVLQDNLTIILREIDAFVEELTRGVAVEEERLRILETNLNAGHREQMALEDQYEARKKDLGDFRIKCTEENVMLTTKIDEKMRAYEDAAKTVYEAEAVVHRKLAESEQLEAEHKEIDKACSKRARELLDAQKAVNDSIEQLLNELNEE